MVDMDPKIIEALLSKRTNLNEKHPNFKALIYGDLGTGKTVAAMQIAQAITPKGKTIEYIDFLEGWVSLLNHPGLTDRTNRQEYEGLSQLEFLGEAIQAKVKPFDTVGTVILDEFSSMTKSDLDIVLKSRAAKDASKDANVPTQPDFYSNTERSRRAITKLLQADVNVIMLAHLREDKLSNGRVVTRPSFMPSFNGTVSQMLHLITFMSAEEFQDEEGNQEYKRTLQIHPTRSISAKTRVGGLSVNVTVPTLIPVVKAWMQGKVETVEVDENTGENLIVLPDADVVVEETDDEFAITMD